MQCEEVREQFADYVRDASHGPVRPELAHHLAVCESCRTEAGELKELWETLGYIPAAEPSPQMRARFETMLEAYSHGLDHAGAKRWWQSMHSSLTAWWPRQPLLQFGLAFGLLILGFAVGHQTRPAASAAPNGEITQ